MNQTIFSRRALLGISLAVMAASPALAADPTGDWLVEKGVAKIRVADCNGALWGVVAWEKTPGGRDKNNPDASKRDRLTLGIATLINFKKKPGVDEWEGQAYDARTTGGKFDTTMKPIGADKLEIKGCFMFICDGQTWTRASGPIPSSPVNAQAASSQGAAVRSSAAPKSTAPKLAPGDIGDVCLLPDVSRLAH